MKATIEEMHEDTDRRVGEVFRTMLIFTVFMVLGPISTYFWTKGYVFEGNFNPTPVYQKVLIQASQIG